MDLNRDNKRKNFHEASLKVFVILSIRQIQIKIILGFHLPLVKVAKSERTTAGGIYDWGSRLESPQTRLTSDTAVHSLAVFIAVLFTGARKWKPPDVLHLITG